jgi:hypothetical protein
LSHPLTPLQRDHRGQEIQRKALIFAVAIGLLVYLISSQFIGLVGISLSGNLALAIAVITYFTAQFILFARA